MLVAKKVLHHRLLLFSGPPGQPKLVLLVICYSPLHASVVVAVVVVALVVVILVVDVIVGVVVVVVVIVVLQSARWEKSQTDDLKGKTLISKHCQKASKVLKYLELCL